MAKIEQDYVLNRYKGRVIQVVDGDSVWLELDVGFRMTTQQNFRLFGINAPEKRSRDANEKSAAYAAADHLESLIPPGTEVVVQCHGWGKYGRWLVTIYNPSWFRGKETSVNQTMIDDGHAKPYFGGKR